MKSRSRFWWIAVALLVDCCRAFGGLLSRFVRVSRWETTIGPSPYPTSTREGRGKTAGGAHRLRPTEQKQPAHPSLVIVDLVSTALADADTSQTGPARTFLHLLSRGGDRRLRCVVGGARHQICAQPGNGRTQDPPTPADGRRVWVSDCGPQRLLSTIPLHHLLPLSLGRLGSW